MKMKTKAILLATAMLLTIGSANAEISTAVKSVTDDTVKLPKDTPCFVQARAFFGNGDKSPLSGFFADGGLTVADNKGVACHIVVGATVNLPLNPNDPGSVKPMPADWIMNDMKDRENRTVEAALQSTSLAQEASEQNKDQSVLGETAGASVGATFGLAGAAGGAMLGALFDDKKKGLPAGVAAVYADLKFKDAQGKSHSTDVVVYAASTTQERPIDLLRAAVKRVVAELQTKQDASNSASASAKTEIPAQEVRL
ncbi:MAG: hypothetical protein Q8O64_20760 [Sideroxyarcus sp.]|nr:hypothetical protein [Sideroxyarcus sp.]